MNHNSKRPLPRRRKAIVRRLQFECCEERTLLAAAPIADLLTLTQVDPNTLPANVAVEQANQPNSAPSNGTVPANSFETSNNTASNGTVADHTNDVNGSGASAPIVAALNVVDAGEGGFERFILTPVADAIGQTRVQADARTTFTLSAVDVTATQGDFYYLQRENGQKVQLSNGTNLLDALTIRSNLLPLDVGKIISNEVQDSFSYEVIETSTDSGRRTDFDSDGDRQVTVEAVALDVAANKVMVFGSVTALNVHDRVVEEHIRGDSSAIEITSPEQTSVTITQLNTAIEESNHSLDEVAGEGEFVRLSVGSYDEQIAIAQSIKAETPDAVTVQLATSTQQVVSQVAFRPSNSNEQTIEIASANDASVAWELELVPVSHIAMAFDVSDFAAVPASDLSRLQNEDNSSAETNGVIKSKSSMESATPATDGEILPNADAVSFSIKRQSENFVGTSTTYLSISPLTIAVAGAILVKDRWKKLQPSDKKRKPR